MTNEHMLPKPISTDEDYRIACYFHDNLTERFSHWKIKFDMTTFELKQYTHVQSNGWNIYYQFGYDNEPYMEVYSTHRMASDSYTRYFADGTKLTLPAFSHIVEFGKERESNEWNEKVRQIVINPQTGILRGI